MVCALISIRFINTKLIKDYTKNKHNKKKKRIKKIANIKMEKKTERMQKRNQRHISKDIKRNERENKKYTEYCRQREQDVIKYKQEEKNGRPSN